MGTQLWTLNLPPFQPAYVLPNELSTYGLPSTAQQPDIMTLVSAASSLIDEYCGRMDGDGNGSLAITTYMQRVLLQTRNRNLVMLPMHPLTPLDPWLCNTLIVAATGAAASGQPNYYYTGAMVSDITSGYTGQLSALLSCSGRYGYTRQDMAIAYPDLFAFINPLNLITLFGGPAPWVAMDVSQADYQSQTGECWIPAGLQLQRYSEIWITYNSGYNPLCMPFPIKQACSAVTKNLLAKGGGTTALLSMSLSRAGANASLMQTVIDPAVDMWLTPYRNTRAY